MEVIGDHAKPPIIGGLGGIKPPFAPMEALLVGELPADAGWQYEPKWDGFRCLAFRQGADIYLQSKSGQPLARYFPELVAALGELRAEQFVLDGEIVIPHPQEGSWQLSFDDLLQRIHPAESRIRKLAHETPALYIVFDLLVDAQGESLIDQPLERRRRKLEQFALAYLPPGPLPQAGGGVETLSGASIRLSPATTDYAEARRWLAGTGGALDGVIAKLRAAPYHSGDREAMRKVKVARSADCVIGGFRYSTHGKVVGSLLLGLYDEAGLLHHVGFISGLSQKERAEITPQLEALIQLPGFTGQAPGGPSRWSTERSTEWQPLEPVLVVEVGYDHFTGGRFRHGARLLRFRPDKSPRECTLAQVARESQLSPLALLQPTARAA